MLFTLPVRPTVLEYSPVPSTTLRSRARANPFVRYDVASRRNGVVRFYTISAVRPIRAYFYTCTQNIWARVHLSAARRGHEQNARSPYKSRETMVSVNRDDHDVTAVDVVGRDDETPDRISHACDGRKRLLRVTMCTVYCDGRDADRTRRTTAICACGREFI